MTFKNFRTMSVESFCDYYDQLLIPMGTKFSEGTEVAFELLIPEFFTDEDLIKQWSG